MSAAMVQWHYADLENRMYCNLKDGRKISMPRYFKLKLYSDEVRKEIGRLTLGRKRLRDPDVISRTDPFWFEAVSAAFRRADWRADQNDRL